MRDFQQLEIWQRSHQLTLNIYTRTQVFPKEELFGLTSQMRRSAASIPTNIAEGCGLDSSSDFRRFLIIAAGSISELQYQLILCKDLRYLNETVFKELLDETSQIRKMLHRFAEKLKADGS